MQDEKPKKPEKISIKIDEEVEKIEEKTEKEPKKEFLTKRNIIILAICAVVLGAGIGAGGYFLFGRENSGNEGIFGIFGQNEKKAVYSPLTGLETEANLVNAPTYCVQVPNGTDGARPQAGLNEAGVVFEAIAEAGITRFAAIFQNPETAVIGPIRSLRMYYLNWDTPFDCTVVHAGGAYDALEALKADKHRDLTENYTYMWRGSTATAANRRWNNLFTSAEYLKKFGQDAGYNSSNVKGFTRETPEMAEKARIENLAINPLDIDAGTNESVKDLVPKVSKITFNFGYMDNYNPQYVYDAEKNAYLRFYASGVEHAVYDCSGKTGEITPETACGEPVQLAPKVVIAMMVQEKKASDNYHEDITAIGSGKAFVFQNGDVIEGTWTKESKGAQIVFKDQNSEEIKLIPGQTFISAVPNYGEVLFE